MRGHMEQRGPNRWLFRVYIGFVNGRRHYATRTFRGNKRQAETALAAFLVEVTEGKFDPTTATVKQLLDRWMKAAEPGLSPNTIREYRRTIDKNIVPRIGSVRLRSLRPATLDQLYSDLQVSGGAKGLSPRSIRQVHAILHRALQQGIRWGWVGTNPASAATPPKIPRSDPQPPEAGDTAKLLAHARAKYPELAPLLHLASVTGARRGELCGLQWADLDLVARAVTIRRSIAGQNNGALVAKSTKTGQSRRVAIDANTVDVLARHKNVCEERCTALGVQLEDSAYVFSPDPTGARPWRPDGISLAVGRIKRKLGLKTDILGLRHAVATQLLGAGVPVRTVSGRLGHTNAATTLNVYAAWLPESDREAAEIMAKHRAE